MKSGPIYIPFLLLLVLVLATFFLADMLFYGAQWWPFHHDKAPYGATATRLGGVRFWLEHLHEEKGEYPKNLQELSDWMGLAPDDEKRTTSYLDGWKHTIRYVIDNPKLNVGRYDLYSVGPNGRDDYDKPDFGDDIHILVTGEIKFFGKERE